MNRRCSLAFNTPKSPARGTRTAFNTSRVKRPNPQAMPRRADSIQAINPCAADMALVDFILHLEGQTERIWRRYPVSKEEGLGLSIPCAQGILPPTRFCIMTNDSITALLRKFHIWMCMRHSCALFMSKHVVNERCRLHHHAVNTAALAPVVACET